MHRSASLDRGIAPFFVTWCNYRCWFFVGKALWRWFYPRSRKKDHFQTLATGVPKLKTWLGTQRVKVARNEVKNASFAQRSAHRDSRIWRPELIEPAAERSDARADDDRRSNRSTPTHRFCHSAIFRLITPYNVWCFWVSRYRSIILVKKMENGSLHAPLKTWIIENVYWSQKRLGILPSSLRKVFLRFFLQMNPIPMRKKTRGVHSIVRRLRTNPPRKINLRFFFFSFCFLPPRLLFIQMNRKRMSLTGVLLQHSNWNCELEVAGELQRRRTGWAGSGSGHRYRDRDRQRVWTWCTRRSGSRRRSDVVQCRD